MDKSLLTDNLVETINGFLGQAFATVKHLEGTVPLVLYRDSNTDGDEVTIPAQEVLVSFARREPSMERGDVSRYLGQDGEFEKEAPFNIRPGDRFRLPPNPGQTRGLAGTVNIVLPEESGTIRALFTIAG